MAWQPGLVSTPACTWNRAALFFPASSNFGSRFPVLTDWLPCGAEPYCRAWLSFQQTLVDLADDHYHAADLPTAICVRHISSTYSLLSE